MCPSREQPQTVRVIFPGYFSLYDKHEGCIYNYLFTNSAESVFESFLFVVVEFKAHFMIKIKHTMS